MNTITNFKLNDIVFAPTFGFGKVVYISDSEAPFNVQVVFDNDSHFTGFTPDGKKYTYEEPILIVVDSEKKKDEIRDNKKNILKDVKEYGFSLKYASERLRDDKEVVLTAVKKGVYPLRYASERLRNDKEFLKEIENIAK